MGVEGAGVGLGWEGVKAGPRKGLMPGPRSGLGMRLGTDGSGGNREG